MKWVVTLALLAACGLSRAQRWDFHVFLDDSPIGHHHFALRDIGNGERELKSEARFDVKILFINAYRYAHDATERWRGNCLTDLTASTNDNGAQTPVSATQRDGRLLIEVAGRRESVDGCVMGFAYWTMDMLNQKRLLNPQTGKLEAVTITQLSDDNITVRGASLAAKRYRITGPKNPIELWYSADRQWLALQSTVEGGRRLRYQLK